MHSNENEPDSFYNIFTYYNMMHNAIDYGIVYECCDITKNITTKSGIKLIDGMNYEAVWFLFDKGLFQFIDWVNDPTRPGSSCKIPNPSTLIEIPQSELSPFLKW